MPTQEEFDKAVKEVAAVCRSEGLTTDFLEATGLERDLAEEVLFIFVISIGNKMSGKNVQQIQEIFNNMAPYIIQEMLEDNCRLCNQPAQSDAPASWTFSGEDARYLGAPEGKSRMVFVKLCDKCFNSEGTDKKLREWCRQRCDEDKAVDAEKPSSVFIPSAGGTPH